LPADLNWDKQYSFPLTMSAVKGTPATPTTPTQLDTLKNSLRIPLDLKDDDALLQSYLDGATEYLKSTLDEENAGTRLDSKRARVVINALAELMYQNRGDDTVTKDLPFTLRALINQLKY
ncbi:head-tail connector protein, partial [Lactiplantibacillus pentosus]